MCYFTSDFCVQRYYKMAGLKQPDSFLDKPGPITMLWKTWVAQFENYLVASRGTNYPVARKKGIIAALPW